MTKKIERIITDCSICIHSKQYKEQIDFGNYALICAKKDIEHRFLIKTSENIIRKTKAIPIPDNCPLEDYKEPQK